MNNKRTFLRIVRVGTMICILGFCPIANLTHVAKADPGDDCSLVAGKSWVKIMVYREVGDNQKGAPIWRHPVDLFKDSSQRIIHGQAGPNQRLRYDYANTQGDELHGNVGFTCKNNEKIIVP
jgi:hypothetical protein